MAPACAGGARGRVPGRGRRGGGTRDGEPGRSSPRSGGYGDLERPLRGCGTEGGLRRILLPNPERTPWDGPGRRAVALCCLPCACPGHGLPGFVGRSVSNASRGPSSHHGARHVAGATRKPAERRRTLIWSPRLAIGAPVCRALPAGSCPQPGRALGTCWAAGPASRKRTWASPRLPLAPAGESAPPAVGNGVAGTTRLGEQIQGPAVSRSPGPCPGARPSPSLTSGGAGETPGQGARTG